MLTLACSFSRCNRVCTPRWAACDCLRRGVCWRFAVHPLNASEVLAPSTVVFSHSLFPQSARISLNSEHWQTRSERQDEESVRGVLLVAFLRYVLAIGLQWLYAHQPCPQWSGLFGFHRFYLNSPCTGFLFLLTGGCWGIGWLFDLCLIPGYECCSVTSLRSALTACMVVTFRFLSCTAWSLMCAFKHLRPTAFSGKVLTPVLLPFHCSAIGGAARP